MWALLLAISYQVFSLEIINFRLRHKLLIRVFSNINFGMCLFKQLFERFVFSPKHVFLTVLGFCFFLRY